MRYLFTTKFGGVTDGVVLDLETEHQAWRQAVAASGEALSDIDGHLGIPDSFIMRVSDEGGRSLFELEVSTRRLRTD